MDGVWGEFAKYGFGGLMCGVMLWYLVKNNNALTEKVDKQTEWQIQFIQSNTTATMTEAQAKAALTTTVQALADAVKDLDRTIKDKIK